MLLRCALLLVCALPGWGQLAAQPGQQLSLNLYVRPGGDLQAALLEKAAGGRAPQLYLSPLTAATRVQGLFPLNRYQSADFRSTPEAGWFSVVLPAQDSSQLLDHLKGLKEVQTVEWNYRRSLHHYPREAASTAAQNDLPYHQQLIGVPALGDSLRGQGSLRIGVLDTGLEYTLPMFRNGGRSSCYINPGEDLNGNGFPDDSDLNGIDDDGNGYVDDIIGYDFTDQPSLLGGGDDLNQDPDPFDDNGHGTAVAGVIAAQPNSTATGVAYGLPIVPLRAFSASGIGEDDDVSRAIIYAADNGIRVLNLSFGDIYPSEMMAAACRYAYNKGVVLITSAGNAAGDNMHYPAGFPEVLSISASDWNSNTGDEFLWAFSNYGHTIDLAAPGSNILTTALYDSTRHNSPSEAFERFSGTSFAAPQVAAAAGLLLEQRPELSPQAVRGILVSTAKDIDKPGWDHFTGGGRLDIPAALDFPTGALVEILSPINDQGTAASEWVIRGTALHPMFSSWSLRWRYGTESTGPWNYLRQAVPEQAFADALAEWDLSQLPDTSFTLSLVVELTDGRTVEDRIRVLRQTAPPTLAPGILAPAWEAGRRVLLFTYRTHQTATCTLGWQAGTDSSTWRSRPLDKRNFTGYAVLRAADFSGSGPRALQLECHNAAGLHSSTDTLTFLWKAAQMPYDGATQKPWSLPMGAYLPHAFDLDADGHSREVVMSRFDSSLNFGPLEVWQFKPQQAAFQRLDSLTAAPILIPKAYRDHDGDGRAELLANFSDSLYILEQTQPLAPFFQQEQTDFNWGRFPADFSELTGDTQLELLARDTENRYIYSHGEEGWTAAEVLPDTNTNEYGSGPPRMVAADVNQNNRQEIWFGDYDGNLYVYEQTDQQLSFQQIFYESLPRQVAASNYLTQGDYDGDGQPEVFVATHTSPLRNTDFDYDPPYWTLRIYDRSATGSFEVVWEDYLLYVYNTRYNAATAAQLDTDPAQELLFTAYPYSYVLDGSAGEYRFRWFGPGLATDHVVGDFDGNGMPEFAIGEGDSARVWEFRSTTFAEGIQLLGQVANDSTATFQWNSINPGGAYRVLRQRITGDTLAPTFDILAQTDSLRFTDNALELGQQYAYLVEGIGNGDTTLSNLLQLTVAPATQLLGAEATDSLHLQVQFSGPMQAESLRPEQFLLASGRQPAQLLQQHENALLLAFDSAFVPGPDTLLLGPGILDAHLRPLATAPAQAPFAYFPPASALLYLRDWAVLSPTRARLVFNRNLVEPGQPRENYTVLEQGEVVAVNGVPGRNDAVELEISGAVLGPTGRPVAIRVSGLEGEGGAHIQPGQGDVAIFTENASDLGNVYVYPNPVRPNRLEAGCTFAGIPPQSTITILTPNGHRLRVLEETNRDGGIPFDLRDQNGTRLAPGVYLYRVAAPDGSTVLGKFAVLE